MKMCCVCIIAVLISGCATSEIRMYRTKGGQVVFKSRDGYMPRAYMEFSDNEGKAVADTRIDLGILPEVGSIIRK